MSAADDAKQPPEDEEVDYEEEADEYTTDANPRHRDRALSPAPAVHAPVAPPLSNRQRRRQRKIQAQERAAAKYRQGGQGPPALRGRLGPLGGSSIALEGRLGPLGCAPGHLANQCPNRAPPGPPPGPPAAAL
jgi:hypothetical protein